MNASHWKCCFKTKETTKCADWGLLIVRLVAGAAFILHGYGKIQNPMGWMGPEAKIPGFFQMLAAVSEFGGGIAWILGLLTPLFSAGLLCTMVVAVYTHMVVMGDPFVSTGGGSYELAAVYLSTAVLLLSTGPGKYSIDSKLFGKQ